MVTDLIDDSLRLDPALFDEPLRCLCAALARRHVRCRLSTTWLSGDPDVRIVAVREPPGAITVEVLCEAPPRERPDHWHAVRVDGTLRQVWRGPSRKRQVEAAAQFVVDLLCQDPAALRPRYLLLG